MKVSRLALIFLALLAAKAFSVSLPVLQFMPDNELYMDDKIEEPANVSEEDFDRVIDEVAALYSGMIKESHKAHLIVSRSWDDPTVNAYANRSGNVWQIHLFGGFARRKEISVDSFQLVICHEMGHHLAGFPFSQWASNEGNSDYFSTLSCARDLWMKDKAKNALAAKKIPAYPKKICDDAWKLKDERHLCYRAALAGKSLADLLSAGAAKYESPDQSVVRVTNNAHPNGQCRLDTYIAGAVCKAKFDPRVLIKSEAEARKYSCFGEAQRPKCWFKPSK